MSDVTLSILVVTAMYPHAEHPGSGAFVMHQVTALRSLGHHVDVIHIRGYRSKWHYLRGALSVALATWRTRYDLVHVHYGLTGIAALVRWHTPLVVTLHGSDVLQGVVQPLVSRAISHVADATIVVSDEIAVRCPGTLIPCGVDLETFRPVNRQDSRQRLGLPLTKKLVLFPFDPHRRVKRYDLASAAVQSLSEQGMEISIVPVWNVPNEDMPLYYSAADVMILCSDTEGSPTSVKEALACNLPLVCTDVGDVRSMLAGVDGIDICRGDVDDLAAALARVLTHAERIPFDGRSAAARFSQARTVQALVDVYRRVLHQGPQLAPSPSCR